MVVGDAAVVVHAGTGAVDIFDGAECQRDGAGGHDGVAQVVLAERDAMGGQVIDGVERWFALRGVKQHALEEGAEGVAVHGVGGGGHKQGGGLYRAAFAGAQSLGAAGDQVEAADRVVKDFLDVLFSGDGGVEDGAAQGGDLIDLHAFFKADVLVGVGESF